MGIARDRLFRGQPHPMPLRVLIAEDEVMVALSMADLLEDEGYEVTVAGDGAKALVAARQLGDDLSVLLTDLNMPCMSGEDLIRALQAERPGLPMIVVTGSAPPGGLEDLQGSDGSPQPCALLHKPVDYDELIVALQRAIIQKKI
ncbi:response regulator [Belnapia sp. T6]|uniref:Response regulator n=1 Tax=Belnapia mucosa TaxID=2804532 RepID=A0ABS1VBR4_9PROT|nr:response regulator [Belnapia mucosa]MBL6459116.1 response regulator [Belnapia mucosa]